MSDVTDLKAEVLLLRQENKELREHLEESEHDASMAWDRALKAESVSKGLRMARDVWQKNDAKLRELVRDMWQLINDLDATPYVIERHGNNPAVTWLDDDWSVHESCRERMRDLGIEVPA